MWLNPWFYTAQMVISILIVLLIVLSSILPAKDVFKYILTTLAITIIVIHYILVIHLTHYLILRVYPFMILEETTIGKSLSPDYGQLLILFTLILWRKEIKNMLKKILSFAFIGKHNA